MDIERLINLFSVLYSNYVIMLWLIISGLFFHAAYIVARSGGIPLMRLQKQPSLLQRRFRIEKLARLNRDEEVRIILSLMMMNLHERERG